MIDTEERTEVSAEPPALPGRWTICAMLFGNVTLNCCVLRMGNLPSWIAFGMIEHYPIWL